MRLQMDFQSALRKAVARWGCWSAFRILTSRVPHRRVSDPETPPSPISKAKGTRRHPVCVKSDWFLTGRSLWACRRCHLGTGRTIPPSEGMLAAGLVEVSARNRCRAGRNWSPIDPAAAKGGRLTTLGRRRVRRAYKSHLSAPGCGPCWYARNSGCPRGRLTAPQGRWRAGCGPIAEAGDGRARWWSGTATGRPQRR